MEINLHIKKTKPKHNRFTSYIKRFDYMITTKLAKYIDDIEVEDEI